MSKMKALRARLSLRALFIVVVSTVAATFSLSTLVALAAWSDPTAAPTGGNPSAPLHVGSTPQSKGGDLSVNGAFTVWGDAYLDGAATAADSNINLTMTERSALGGSYTWRLWTSDSTGSGGLSGNALEVWEYPDTFTSPGTGARARLRILKSAANLDPYRVDINSSGDVLLQGGRLTVFEDPVAGNRNGRLEMDTDGHFNVSSNGARQLRLNWWRGTGGVHVGNGASTYGPISASAFTVVSSRSLKKDIATNSYGLGEVLKLNPVNYHYIDDVTATDQIGLIAEDVVGVVPEVVTRDTNGDISGIDYSKLTVPLINAVKTLDARVSTLEARVEAAEQTILKSPNGTCFEVRVGDDGKLSTAKVHCTSN